MTVSYAIMLLGATVVGAAMPAVVAFFLTHDFWYTIATYAIFVFGVVLPFDRWLDTKRPVERVQ